MWRGVAAQVLIWAVLGCGGGDGGSASDPDAAIADDGGVCRPFESRRCESGSSVWVDSCGNLGELAEECTGDAFCDEDWGRCCLSQGDGDLFSGNPWTTSVSLTHSASGTEGTWSLRLDEVEHPTDVRGQVLFWRIPIDGGFARFGFASHIFNPTNSTYEGFGIYWVAESVADLADIEPGAGTSEGMVSLGGVLRHRLPGFDHQTLDLRLARQEAAGGGDWFALFASIDGAPEVLIGRARHARANIDARATLASTSQVVVQVGGVEPAMWSALDLSLFRVSTTLPGLEGEPPSTATLNYGAVASPPFVSSELLYNESEEHLEFAHGTGVDRCNQAGPLF